MRYDTKNERILGARELEFTLGECERVICLERHPHEAEEVVCVLEGGMLLECEDGSFIVRDGDVVVLRPRELYSARLEGELTRVRFLLAQSSSLERRGELLPTGESDSFAERMREFVAKNYRSEITTELLLREFPYSHSHFCRLFKSKFGTPFSAYLRNFRIERALDALGSDSVDERKISDIAFSVGFTDYCYFTHSFKMHLGVTPREYLKSRRSE